MWLLVVEAMLLSVAEWLLAVEAVRLSVVVWPLKELVAAVGPLVLSGAMPSGVVGGDKMVF